MRRSLLFSLLLVSAAVGCKKARVDASPDPSAGPAASTGPATLPPRCQALSPARSFTVGDPGPQRPSGGDDASDEDQAPLPFAVELGRAVAFEGGFAVGALRAKGSGTTALVALVGRDGGGGRLIELGPTHGDVDPPSLAARGSALVAVVPDSDAGGGRLRLARIDPKAASVTWGGELSESRDESHAMDVELGAERAVVVWDEVIERRGVIRVASFAAADPSNVTAPRTLSPPEQDAEAPQLARRQGGYWAAWIVRASEAEPDTKPGKAAPSPAPPAASALPDPPLVELGRRGLRVAPLDENGALMGAPVDITGDSHVLVFDLVTGADGRALIAYRDEHTSPGVEAETVRFAMVRADGSVDRHELSDSAVGAGVPTLLVDAAAKPGLGRVWLSLGGVTDRTRLGALDDSAKIADRLDVEAALRAGDPLAVSDGHLLIAEPRGLSMVLSVAGCRPGKPAAP